MGTGRNLKTIGRQNIEHVFKLLMVEKAISRGELARRIGVSKMTISNIITHLKDAGYVYEYRAERNMTVSGPVPTAVSIVPKRIIAVGVHITTTVITVQEVDVVDGVLYESQATVDNLDSNQQLIRTIKEMLSLLFYEIRDHQKYVVGIGITYSGGVDSNKGSIHFKTNQIEKEEVVLKNVLEKTFDLPVVVSNEIEGATIAELVFGESFTGEKMYYINAGDYIRGEFIHDHLIMHGVDGRAGELGHVSVKYDGPLCLCGARGCYNLYASVSVLLEKSNCYSLEELQLKIEARDALALRVIEEYIQISANVFTNLVNIYDPKYLLIGGEITRLDPSIFRKIERLVNERIIYRKDRYVKIVISAVRGKASTVGAAMVVFEELFCYKE